MRKAAGIAFILMLLAGCDRGPPPPLHMEVDLGWDFTGAQVADGRATLSNDQGYVVELEDFGLVTYSVELMTCDPLPPPKPPGTAFNFIGTAWAGHTAGHPVTRTNLAGVEHPLQQPTTVMDKYTPPDVAYCGAHYLIARILDPQPGGDASTTGFSIRLKGRYRKNDATDWTQLALETAVAHGVLKDITGVDPKKGRRFKDGVVTVTRQIKGMFDGVDFAAMDEPAAARQILRQIVAGTTVSWRAQSI